jgi:hypothetical protein
MVHAGWSRAGAAGPRSDAAQPPGVTRSRSTRLVTPGPLATTPRPPQAPTPFGREGVPAARVPWGSCT